LNIMLSSPAEQQALRDTEALETSLSAVESHLQALGNALKGQDASAAEAAATELHLALAQAVDRFALAARRGGLPPALRRRLALTSGQVAAQRDAVSRASSSLDRAIDLLLPASAPTSGYGNQGHSLRSPGTGLAQA
jgi:hypothetical protein